MSPAIVTESLCKRYGDTTGVDGVSLIVENGDMVGFIGPNGAGKSTTIRLLLGLLRPTSGEARVFGEPSWSLAPDILRRVGYLPSSVRYYDRMRVRSFLATTQRLYGIDCSAKIKELCTVLDVDTSRRFGELSMGNRKKVGIVQCLMHSPDIVILDEPTSGLDPLIQARFFELLARENARGVTVFLSSHTLSEVQDHCRRVAIIRNGIIVEKGDVSELRSRQYRRVHLSADDSTITRVVEHVATSVEAQTDGTVTLLFRGPVGELLSLLDPARVRDLVIQEPTLEEIFLHYYTTEAD